MDGSHELGTARGAQARCLAHEPGVRVRGLTYAAALLLLVSALLLGLAGCTGRQAASGGNTSSSPGELSRCGVCNGSGWSKDYNRDAMEVCRYCNGRGMS